MLRRSIILEEESQADSNTKTVSIPGGKKISALEVTVKADNGSTNNQDNDIHSILTKLELRHEAGAIKDYGTNVAGTLCQAASFYRGVGVAPDYLSEEPNETQRGVFIIPFGRYVGDRQYFLDSTRFNNLHLDITSNLAANSSTGATGFQSNTKYIQVTAIEFYAEPIKPLGLIYTRQMQEFNTSASGRQDIDMNIEGKLARLLVRPFEAATAVSSSITNIDVPGFVKDEAVKYIEEAVSYQFPKAEVARKLHKADTDTVNSRVGHIDEVTLEGTTDDIQYVVSSISGNQVTITARNHPGGTTANSNYTTDATIYAVAKGKLYHNMLVVPFDMNDDITSLPSRRDLPEKMWIEQGNAGARCSVLVEEVRTY